MLKNKATTREKYDFLNQRLLVAVSCLLINVKCRCCSEDDWMNFRKMKEKLGNLNA